MLSDGVLVLRRLGRFGCGFVFAFACGAAACGRDGATASPSGSVPSAPASITSGARPPPPAPADVAGRLRALASAELRRASRDVTPADLSDRAPEVRRAAARALARIADARAVELLTKSLADEDADVVVWAAYGLGFGCGTRGSEIVRALSTRAASWLAFAPPAATLPAAAGSTPVAALADALGRCGGPEAERALSAWLTGAEELAEPAALALGRIAAREGRLEDTSIVALLEAASRKPTRVAAALQAFTRLTTLGEAARSRLLVVARAGLAASRLERTLAVRALAQAGTEAANDLIAVLIDAKFESAERADAARGLGRLGPAGQAALLQALPRLLAEPGAITDTGLMSAHYGVLSAALDALQPGAPALAAALAPLLDSALPEAAPPRRRVVSLRCRAAAAIAGREATNPRLLACDPDLKGRAGRLAHLSVLGRAPLRAARLRRFLDLAATDDAVVRERALELLTTHPEVPDSAALLARALASAAPGEVATAARLIADYPERAASAAGGTAPDPELVRGLTAAASRFAATSNIEVRGTLADAAGRLELLGEKPRLELDCRSDNPTLRVHAERALRLLGSRGVECNTFEPAASAPSELSRTLVQKSRLELATDAGPLWLELDPALSPIAATRVADLARSGFYDGVAVHRVVHGFVAQFGDPGGDGYGGTSLPPLRCETASAAFERGDVGIALSGRDTGSSQFFVTLARHPHLDGDYARIGKAGPGWDRLAEGDVVHKITLR
jgi:cyclophilin family peptidyl-prolyl cis-trans isomerase/HEAT repeat protein